MYFAILVHLFLNLPSYFKCFASLYLIFLIASFTLKFIHFGKKTKVYVTIFRFPFNTFDFFNLMFVHFQNSRFYSFNIIFITD